VDGPERFTAARRRAPSEILVVPGLCLKTRALIDPLAWYAMIAENRDFLGTFFPWAKEYPEDRAVIHHIEACNNIERGTLASYGIYKEDALVGAVSLYNIRDSSAQLGYWLTEEAEGKGIMTAAAARLLKMGFDDLGLKTVGAAVLPDNHRSRAVIERLGGRLDDVDEAGRLAYIIFAASR
jgi:RimJ/RimL family protein N-acetyltransferase